MATYPTITALVKGMEEQSVMKTVKSESEANYVQTRSRATKRKRIFNVKYPLMLLTEYQTLRTFFEETVFGEALYFTWTNPIDSVSYTVRYKDEVLKCSYYCNLWVANVSFILEEV